MFNALIAGKLIKAPKLGTTKTGKPYCSISIRASIQATEAEDADAIFVSGIAFGSEAESLGRLGQGDAVSITGNAKLQSWEKEGKIHTGLNVLIAGVLTPYQVKKRRGESGDTQKHHSERREEERGAAQRFYGRGADRGSSRYAPSQEDFNDEMDF